MVRKIVLSIVAILSLSVALAQNQQVTGTVKDAAGDPVIGATVLIDGTSIGTTTGLDGRFAISAPANAVLSVSFIGYNPQRIELAGKTSLQIVLEESSQKIDDVIVVAFGTTKKEAFTGSVSVLRSEDLENRQTTNVMNALVGSVAGLQMRGSSGQPGSTGSINVRGLSSMYATIDPLVIVDGSPYSASLSNIAQSDIESVTVLKDAASAALYGARGAAGVIIVTTKRASSKKAVINVDMKWGVNSRAIQEYDVITDPGEYYEAYYSQLYNQYFYGQGMDADAANLKANQQMLSDLKYNVYSYGENEQLIGTDGRLNPNATLGRALEGTNGNYWLTPDDWIDETYRSSLRQEYNVSVNGTTNRTNYYMSAGYLRDEGIIHHSDYERVTARLKADYAANKWLKLGANIGFVSSKSHQQTSQGSSGSSTSTFAFTSMIAPIYPVYIRQIDENGNPYIVRDAQGKKMYDYSAGASSYPGLVRPYLSTGNPLGLNEYDKTVSGGNQLNGTFTVDVDITSWLKFNATSMINWGFSEASYMANMFYGNSVATGGAVTKSNTHSFRTNNIQTLTFAKTYGKHDINVMAGHEYYRTRVTYLSAKGQGLFSPEIPEIDATAKKVDSSSYTSGYNVEGWMLSAQYNYDTKYYLSASYRRDASSYFAKDHRWGDFWSVGGAWLIQKENFMSNASWIDILKLKASIGQQGNDSIGQWAYVDLFQLIKNDDTSMSSSFYRKGNPEITWETTTNLNVGVEFSFWNGRLSGTVDWYRKKTSDLLFWVSIPESSGTRGMYQNVGDIRNSGIEVSLSADLIRTKMVTWNVAANLSHNKTKILSLPAAKISNDLGGWSEATPNGYNAYWYKVGGEMNNVYLAHYEGVDEHGQAMFRKTVWLTDANGNYILDSKGHRQVDHYTTTYDFNDATQYEHGSLMPDVFGGFSTSLRVGNFDIAATFDYQIGGKVYDMHYQSLIAPVDTASGAGTTFHKDYKKAWSPDNTKSNMPRWQYGDDYSAASSDRFLTDASYLNFQSFTVGYTIPEKLFKNHLKMRIYVAGENLCFWSARQGLDPRYAFEGNTSITGYSPARTISGGLQLTF